LNRSVNPGRWADDLSRAIPDSHFFQQRPKRDPQWERDENLGRFFAVVAMAILAVGVRVLC
jgi:hypothetical protein